MIGKLEGLNMLDTLSFDAMNTTFYFSVTSCKITNWKEVMQGWVRYVETEWSRFRANNELGQLNQLEVGEKVNISPPLFDVLQRAEDYRRKTHNLFSPYLLPQMQFHGYKDTFPFEQSQFIERAAPPMYNKETSPFLFAQNTSTVTRAAEGQIDLGGIGKGYTVQAAARWLKDIGEVAAGMVDGGGDITVWSNGCKEWKIGVAHPFQNKIDIAKLHLKNGSIATSNIIYRSWMHGDEKKHHIINGRTGLPANNNMIQATVISDNCLDAEVGAKLCLIETEMNFQNQLQNLSPTCSFLLVNDQGKVLVG
ncbi:FAD:protein FMN transferase [Neobacillus soli]|uniref:FAD:protein FMN transferase n=1 Tax=Neobacillus soli TaxID=220688 RepID=UPI000825F965|nr:FAD:protein FMN transferase [Neobacillus soli]